MIELLSRPWPWWVAGPLIGLMVPALLLLIGRAFGVSSSLRHVCAATLPSRLSYLRYDWRRSGLWNLAFVAGILIGGALAALVLLDPEPIAISAETARDLEAYGIEQRPGLVPAEIYSWAALATPAGLVSLVVGGFLVGFGTRWAGGCTSGHAITGLANLHWSSLVATLGFFAGGLAATHLILPLLF